jgi:hypothetical protein
MAKRKSKPRSKKGDGQVSRDAHWADLIAQAVAGRPQPLIDELEAMASILRHVGSHIPRERADIGLLYSFLADLALVGALYLTLKADPTLLPVSSPSSDA